MSNCVNSPGFRFADPVIANPHLFSLARIFRPVGTTSESAPRAVASRAFEKDLLMGPRSLPLAVADSSTRAGFFLSASRLHFVFVALVHEGGKELRTQGASAQEKRLAF